MKGFFLEEFPGYDETVQIFTHFALDIWEVSL